MRATTSTRAPALALTALLCATVASAQNPVHDHIGHAADRFDGTPGGLGLLPTAIAEAEVASQHAALAARSPGNLDGAKRHAGHVLHAIDPSMVASGPGLGYGLKRAAEGVARHIGLAAETDGASRNVMTHANHVVTATNNAAMNAERVAALAEQIQAATDASAAARLVEEMAAVASALVVGADANGDGRIGWQEGEGGLQQAEQHLTLMKRGEGLD